MMAFHLGVFYSNSSLCEAVMHSSEVAGIIYLALKEEQHLGMKAISDKHNVFAWLPAGYGKSLCYQVLSFLVNFKHGLQYTEDQH